MSAADETQAPALDVAGLTFAYPGAADALAGVTLRVEPGERVAVLGANGAGKSTLLLHVNGLLTPRRGTVAVGGIPVVDDRLREVRRRVGFVFQDPDDQLFLPTLLEDVAFGPLNQGLARRDAADAARAVLAELGLEPAAGRAAHHLSGGEKRLAALATVLVSSPRLLVLDEPTSGLDARARQQVVALLQARPETILLATHDLEVAAALCRRAVILAAGRVVADGPVRELLRDEPLLRAHGLAAPLTGPAPDRDPSRPGAG